MPKKNGYHKTKLNMITKECEIGRFYKGGKNDRDLPITKKWIDNVIKTGQLQRIIDSGYCPWFQNDLDWIEGGEERTGITLNKPPEYYDWVKGIRVSQRYGGSDE